MSEDRALLSNEEARQILGERVPGFGKTLAVALNMEVGQLYREIQAGKVTKLDALAALATLAAPIAHNCSGPVTITNLDNSRS